MELVQQVRKSKYNMLHQIYILKILLLCLKDEENTNKLEYVHKIYESFDSKIDDYLISSSKEDYNMLDNDYHTVESLLKELRDDIVVNHPIQSVVMLDNMKVDEIEAFYKLFKSILSKYDSIKIASNDIFYYSGKDISLYISNLLSYISNHDVPNRNLLPVKVLEQFNNTITLNIKDWLKVIQTIKTTLKYLNGCIDNEIYKLREDFILLNVYYFIVITGGNK